MIFEVHYNYTKGTTPGMGPNPDCVEVTKAYDGMGNNVLHKLPEPVLKDLAERAFEHMDS